jgi:hypothetical protein
MQRLIFSMIMALENGKCGRSYGEMEYKWLLFKWIGAAGWIISETPV